MADEAATHVDDVTMKDSRAPVAADDVPETAPAGTSAESTEDAVSAMPVDGKLS